MTRLTLEWHLRTIVEGIPEVEATPAEEDDYGVSEWEYSDDYSDTGTGPHAKTNGCVNVAYDSTLAYDALHSSAPVAYLDAVAHDPCAPMIRRWDAAELLGHHIMERRLLSRGGNQSLSNETDNEVRSAFIAAQKTGDLPKASMKPGYWSPAQCLNPECREEECLFDPDRPDEPNHCTVCGTKVPRPDYPA